MRTFLLFAFTSFVLSGFCRTSSAQEPPLPPPSRTPILVLDHDGPHAPVTAVAFSPDAKTLYVGGLDKLVHRYELRAGKYVATKPLRVPLGQGNAGAVNAIAVSPDGKWVAVAGRAPIRGEVWAGSSDGVVTRTSLLTPLVKRDFGVVYLFDPKNPAGGRVIRGSQSEVRALAFANPAPASGPALLTAGLEWDSENKRFGTVRVFHVGTGKELASRRDLPATPQPPGLAAWAIGAGQKELRVAIAWDNGDRKQPGDLLVWDVQAKQTQRLPDAAYNGPLAVRQGKNGAGEVVTGGFQIPEGFGRVAFRNADPIGNERVIGITGDRGQFFLPLGVSPITLPNIGDATAVLVRIAPKPAGADEFLTQLRVIDSQGITRAIISLTGVADQFRPVMIASPDGRYLAIGGFNDHHVEVFETATLVGGKPGVQKLPGAAGGFDRVQFLKGDKLWLGQEADTPARGGIVVDFLARTAKPNDAKGEADAPPAIGMPRLTNPTPERPGSVTVVLNGVMRTITLEPGERPTAAVVLPAKPAWDAKLGAIVAVAHTDDVASRTLITLFDAAIGKPIIQLGGPALPIHGLARSGTRPLLAAVGEDRTAFVWSLRDLLKRSPILDGVSITAADKQVMVASVEPMSGAAGKLAAGDVIEAVGGEKGELKPITTPGELVLAVRALRVGDNARVKVQGKAAPVVVPVGTATGHRHPLLTVWVDPVAKNGQHDWIAWTPAGPYDTNSRAAEQKIVWVTATGNPAQPTTFASANQYRPLFYKKDFIRFLLEKADFQAASKAHDVAYPPQRPVLTANLSVPVETINGVRVTREAANHLDVSLSDPANVLALDTAVLRWRVGNGAWQDVPFTGGRAMLPLADHNWTRGEHRYTFAVYTSPDAAANAPPAASTIATFTYIPPPPVVFVAVDGQATNPGAVLTTKNDEVAIAAVVPWPWGPATVTVESSAPGAEAVQLPAKVKLNPHPQSTVIRVTATNRGEGVDPKLESTSVEITVRQLPPDPVPPPRITLTLNTPHEKATSPGAPRVTSTPVARLTATVEDTNAIAAFAWDIGDGKGWVAGELNPQGTAVRDVTLPNDGTPITIKVRTKSAKSPFAEDSISVVFAGLADPEITLPPVRVTNSMLDLSGQLKTPGTLPSTVRVRVTDVETGESRETDAQANLKAGTWQASVELMPGENDIALITRNKWATDTKPGLARVAFVRPPVLFSVQPIDAGMGSVGDVIARVATRRGVPPTELRVNDSQVAFELEGSRIDLFGIEIRTLKAIGIPVKGDDVTAKPGEAWADQVAVLARNAEGNSQPISVEVRGKIAAPVRPPSITLSLGDKPISPGLPVISDQQQFPLRVKIESEKPLTRAELWHRGGSSAVMNPVDSVDPTKAKLQAGIHMLNAEPVIELRRGVNHIRAVVANGGEVSTVEFTVTFAPKPVRVVIDSVTESAPGEEPVPLPVSASGELATTHPILHIHGRVVWDSDTDPVSRDPSLSVVAHADQVTHLPVRVAPRVGTQKERTFVAPVFLHDGTTDVRLELKFGNRATPIPQEGYGQAKFKAICESPLKRQRLHVLIISPEVTQSQRFDLVRKVIEGIGGSIPVGRAGFDRGEFQQPLFERATVYRPLVYDVDQSGIVALGKEVERQIRQTTSRKGEDWLNDVILVYYQGPKDVKKDAGRLIHTTSSLAYKDVDATMFMAPLADLVPEVGAQLAVLNVIDTDPQADTGSSIEAELPIFRIPNKDKTGVTKFPEISKEVVAKERFLGDWAKALGVSHEPYLAGKLTDTIPTAERDREINRPKN